METITPKLEQLWIKLKWRKIAVINGECCNSCSIGLAEKENIQDYVYLHSQAEDSLEETGRAYLGWDLESPQVITDCIDSIEGLAWEMRDENSKVEIFEPDTEWEQTEYSLEEEYHRHPPVDTKENLYQFWSETLADIEYLAPKDIDFAVAEVTRLGFDDLKQVILDFLKSVVADLQAEVDEEELAEAQEEAKNSITH